MAGVGAAVISATTNEQELERGVWSWPVPMWVLTGRDLRVPDGADVRLTAAPVPDVLREIREVTDANVFLVGGGKVVRSILEAGALDELILFVVPVLLRGGIPLFDGVPQASLTPVSTTDYATGLVELRYRFG